MPTASGSRSAPAWRTGQERPGGLADPIGDPAQLAGVGLPVGGQRQPAGEAEEQAHAQVGLEDAHLMADRRLGHVQLVRRAGEAEQAGGGLEGAQGIEGRQRGVHPGHHIHEESLMHGMRRDRLSRAGAPP
jgi:hypothetical protein